MTYAIIWAEWEGHAADGNLELSRRIISFVTHDEQKSLRCMRSYGCVPRAIDIVAF